MQSISGVELRIRTDLERDTGAGVPPVAGTPEDRPEVEWATGLAGTMVMFDGRLWHGAGAIRTTRRRHLLLGHGCRPWIRPQEKLTLSLLDGLGFRTCGTLGNVNGVIVPNGALIERGRPVGPMERTPPPE